MKMLPKNERVFFGKNFAEVGLEFEFGQNLFLFSR